MDINGFIEELGGRQVVIDMTGLTKGRISQWVNENSVPRPWLKYFCERFPVKAKKRGLTAQLEREMAA